MRIIHDELQDLSCILGTGPWTVMDRKTWSLSECMIMSMLTMNPNGMIMVLLRRALSEGLGLYLFRLGGNVCNLVGSGAKSSLR